MRSRHLFIAAFLLTAAVGWAGTASTEPSETKIAIENFSFEPKSVTILAGASVTWVNKDDVPHTVTAQGDNPAFDSGALDTDDKFTIKFSKPGTYKYYCKVHPHMTGSITVK
jgi:plastocyanin